MRSKVACLVALQFHVCADARSRACRGRCLSHTQSELLCHVHDALISMSSLLPKAQQGPAVHLGIQIFCSQTIELPAMKRSAPTHASSWIVWERRITDMMGPGRSATQRCCQSCRDLAGGQRPRFPASCEWQISVQLRVGPRAWVA